MIFLPFLITIPLEFFPVNRPPRLYVLPLESISRIMGVMPVRETVLRVILIPTCFTNLTLTLPDTDLSNSTLYETALPPVLEGKT